MNFPNISKETLSTETTPSQSSPFHLEILDTTNKNQNRQAPSLCRWFGVVNPAGGRWQGAVCRVPGSVPSGRPGAGELPAVHSWRWHWRRGAAAVLPARRARAEQPCAAG